MKLEDIKLRPLVETLRILDISDDEYFEMDIEIISVIRDLNI